MEQSVKPKTPRSDKGHTKLTERDHWVLPQIGEQEAMRLDQLGRLLAQMPQRALQQEGQLALTTVRRIVRRWQILKLVKVMQVFARQPPWVYLTSKGLHEFKLPYREVVPSPALVTHYYYVNEVYFWVRKHYPQDHWLSERRLRKEWDSTEARIKHIPDAEIHRYDEHNELTVIAVEVELTVKERQRSLQIMQQLAESYDGVWYFTNSTTAASVQRTLMQLDEEVRRRFRIRDLADLT